MTSWRHTNNKNTNYRNIDISTIDVLTSIKRIWYNFDMGTKTTIYLSDELRRAVKKHIVDTEQSFSAYAEAALWVALKNDAKPNGRKRVKDIQKMHDLERTIKKLIGWRKLWIEQLICSAITDVKYRKFDIRTLNIAGIKHTNTVPIYDEVLYNTYYYEWWKKGS